ncbi:MAG: MBL fold metallo-hydrolase [Spirochaetes bacterium]|nr:MAG: MBL fold metallo-hydrolase [Spirochaetota bacterium]
MLETSTYEDVIQVRMGREVEGKVLYWVSAYLVDGLLIDTGCEWTKGEFMEFIRNERVETIVNTHFHEDHIGANALVAQHFGVPIYAHRESIPFIKGGQELRPYQEFVWGVPELSDPAELPAELRTPAHTFEVIDTPGHSLGHVALVDRARGWCFSGDIFAREKPKFIRPEEDMRATVDSMRKILSALPDGLVLFTSVGKIVTDGRRALGECIGYLEEYSGKAKHLQDGGADIPSIMNTLFGGEHPFAELTGGHYRTENLVRSLLEM